MNKQEILATIKSLAGSQGLYSRLYSNLMELTQKNRNKVLQELENKNFKDAVDLVMFIEC